MLSRYDGDALRARFRGRLLLRRVFAGIRSPAASEAGQRLVLAVAAVSVAWLLGTAAGRQIATAREAERARVQLQVARDVVILTRRDS
ncbi:MULTISPECIES: hypothetical protein [unclassified Streptosporangium]|uniref:hypothetical protein n=1 Tax=unclassified Streptosporangium TaxID=2632669 RepID=UPI002E298470|nr:MULTISPECIES: hypothetical protein [unclassified Streptosporangium]